MRPDVDLRQYEGILPLLSIAAVVLYRAVVQRERQAFVQSCTMVAEIMVQARIADFIIVPDADHRASQGEKMTCTKARGFWYQSRVGAVALLLALAGCGGGSSGSQGPAGPPGPGGPPGTQPPAATSLNMVITSASVNSPPVVNFTVTNEGGFAYPGLTSADLRFNIAKLITGTNGDPSAWQNYIVRASGGVLQGSQERDRSGYAWGSLADHGDGTYTYTFATDITDPAYAATCPVAPCQTPDGKTVDLSYDPAATTRIGIQMSNSALPLVNATYDFVPNGGAVTAERIIVNTDNCNECHSQLRAHGTRIDTRLCVTCHNPGTWADSTTPVDFKIMIHKIHRSPNLGTNSSPVYLPHNDYAVGSSDFSDVEFPQDTRNCTKCHHDSNTSSQGASPQGDNWETAPNMAACGSCHDDVDFSTGANHQGGIRTNAECLGCHKTGGWAGSIADSHTIPGRAELANFRFNILEVCGTPVDANPTCTPGTDVTVKFSVTDPSGAVTHEHGNAYNILAATTTDPEFTNTTARLTLDVAWQSDGKRDWTNDCGTGRRPSRADGITLGTSTAVTDNGDGTFTFDGSQTTPAEVIPDATTCANMGLNNSNGATGTGVVALEGRMAAKDSGGNYTVRVPVTSQVSYFAITDTTPVARRVVADAAYRCDKCHEVLSLHGNSRNNNVQLCVICHNPMDSDVNDRPTDPNTDLPDPTLSADGKVEESVDFKRMIHGIHAGQASKHGFREKGLVVGTTDFSDMRFPGILSKCDTCHVQVKGTDNNNRSHTFDTYTLEDRSVISGSVIHTLVDGADIGNSGIEGDAANWDLPEQNGILGSTVNSFPDLPTVVADATDFANRVADQSDDEKYSPIASVCSSCHDDTVARSHMIDNSGLVGGDKSGVNAIDPDTGKMYGDPQLIPSIAGEPTQENNVEACPVCHGPGKVADVSVVHN